MELTLLAEKLEEQYRKKLPFVLYALPDSETVVAYFQRDAQLHHTENFTEKSFVMAPFDFKDRNCCIPESESERFETPMPREHAALKDISVPDTAEEMNRHEQLVEKALQAIRNHKAEKIVVSRKKVIALSGFNASEVFKRLFSLYPKAFRYLWYHPETELWCGATPEILVKTEKNSFTTMALAGTQKYSAKTPIYWNEKEIEEQQIVTDAITNSLQKVTDVLKVSKAYTHAAGTLAHLRSDVTGILKGGKATLQTITKALHPTPAVCGTPKQFARDFIKEHEQYDREFYTGFLGPICGDDKCSVLYVNLRAMKIAGTTATLYAGGGITKGSVPYAEWQETQFKLQTMLQVLQPIL
ncbi:isochorismate synthase [Altibacter sp.]|uniref:isochorismate synthase n=1 Tax=Altibacter sp. TaxID=2024823 RepID=UPI000C8EE141|nr:isochorismate synthase [Altibacter sp.]MAP53866.1 isochorismate synthase [Altibacter sp.]